MGNEISRDHYNDHDEQAFIKQLNLETEQLRSLFKQKLLDKHSYCLGYELEVCLLNQHGLPSPVNRQVIEKTRNPQLTEELAKFNLEINGNPFVLSSNVLANIEADLSNLFQQAQQAAQSFDSQLCLFGVLPNLTMNHLNAEQYMSDLNRYHLISEKLISMRKCPVHLQLNGAECLDIHKNDVMLEALGTSFQVHLQIPFEQSVDYYHAALWASLAAVGIAANSPIVLGKSCWHESRIGIFKQAVDTRNQQEKQNGEVPRVFFGKNYIHSIMDLFDENLEYQTIIPELNAQSDDEYFHLNLHNGTVWRWIRPILDRSDNDLYHLRLELRVLPSGPTLIDTMSNLAFYLGLIEGLKQNTEQLTQVPFNTLEQQFYAVAKHGLATPVTWCDKQHDSLQNILLNTCIPLAEQGLKSLGIQNYNKWLNVIKERAKTGQTGAEWMLEYWRNNPNPDALVKQYLSYANQNIPVHLWGNNKLK